MSIENTNKQCLIKRVNNVIGMELKVYYKNNISSQNKAQLRSAIILEATTFLILQYYTQSCGYGIITLPEW